jgi:uncharacterized membrane protein YeiB
MITKTVDFGRLIVNRQQRFGGNYLNDSFKQTARKRDNVQFGGEFLEVNSQRIIRTLHQLHILTIFIIEEFISILSMRHEQFMRQRCHNRHTLNNPRQHHYKSARQTKPPLPKFR